MYIRSIPLGKVFRATCVLFELSRGGVTQGDGGRPKSIWLMVYRVYIYIYTYVCIIYQEDKSRKRCAGSRFRVDYSSFCRHFHCNPPSRRWCGRRRESFGATGLFKHARVRVHHTTPRTERERGENVYLKKKISPDFILYRVCMCYTVPVRIIMFPRKLRKSIEMPRTKPNKNLCTRTFSFRT